MGEEVTIPASVARELAVSASRSIPDERESGYRYNAKSIQESVAHALNEVGVKDGEFVGLNADDVSTLVAYAHHSEAADSIRTGREILEDAGIWA